MKTPTLFIDGDGCNAQTRELAERLSEKGIHIVLVANRKIRCTHEKTHMVVCSTENHAADKHILAHAHKGDLVISKDLELARALLQMYKDEIMVISDSGEKFSFKTIDARIIRSAHAKERRSVGITFAKARHTHEHKKRAKLAHVLDTWRITHTHNKGGIDE